MIYNVAVRLDPSSPTKVDEVTQEREMFSKAGNKSLRQPLLPLLGVPEEVQAKQL